MKKITGVLVFPSVIYLMIACTDIQGDGIDTVIWEGSTVPQDSCYRNPVWEPDLSFPSVYSAAVGYYAIGADNEWSPGLHYTAPVLSSNDLMNWRLRGEAFTNKPAWSEGNITHISGGFSKIKGTYYVFYTLGDDGIGMGGSRAPQGPFTDFGMLINADSAGLEACTNPFFFPFGSRAYIFFQGGDGMYGFELGLERDRLAEIKGDLFKVAGAHVSGMTLIRKEGIYYLFGAEEDGDNSRLIVGRSIEVTGPFLDGDGNSLLGDGGTEVLTGNAENGFVSVNHVGGVFEDGNGELWALYHATDIDIPLLSSGADRHPLMLSKLDFNESGWPSRTVQAKGGWNHPKFPR